MSKPFAIPPVLLVSAAAAQLLLGRKKRARKSLRRRVLGGAAALAGGGVFVAGAVQLAARGTTIDPRDPSATTDLVTDGVYGLTRNPIYLGDVLLLLALAIAQGKLISFAPVAAFAALIDQRQIPMEEQALEAQFGADFSAYAKRVPRWL